MNVQNPRNGAIESFKKCFRSKAFEIIQLEDLRTSLRSYVARIHYDTPSTQKQSLILKRSFVSNLQFEVEWLRFFAEIQIPVPVVYGYFSEEGMLLLEDLGDTNLENMVDRHNRIKEALHILCRIHAVGIVCASRIKQLFSHSNSVKKFDVLSYRRNLVQINLSRLLGLLPKSNFSDSDKNRITQLLMDMVNYITRSNPSAFDPDQASHLIIKDLKPHHFIWHQGCFKIIDLESLSCTEVPQIDLVFLLEDSAFQLSQKKKEDLLLYYIDQINRLTPAQHFKWASFKLIYEYYRFMYKLFIASINKNKSYEFLQEFETIHLINEITEIVNKYRLRHFETVGTH